MRAVSESAVNKGGREQFTAASCLLLLNLLLFLAYANSSGLVFSNDGSSEWWTLYTCHFTHWDNSHYLFNIICFNVIGWILFIRCRWLPVIIVLTVPWLMSGVFYFLSSNQFNYCGLSGLVTALFAALGTWMFLQKEYRIPGAVLILLLALKIAIENIFAVSPLSYSASFKVFPLAHSSGAVLGILITVLMRKKL